MCEVVVVVVVFVVVVVTFDLWRQERHYESAGIVGCCGGLFFSKAVSSRYVRRHCVSSGRCNAIAIVMEGTWHSLRARKRTQLIPQTHKCPSVHVCVRI